MQRSFKAKQRPRKPYTNGLAQSRFRLWFNDFSNANITGAACFSQLFTEANMSRTAASSNASRLSAKQLQHAARSTDVGVTLDPA